MLFAFADRLTSGSIAVAIPPGGSAASWIPLGGALITNVEGVASSKSIQVATQVNA
jgi:hypothetical protein